jgi:malic enzyme
MAEHMMKKQQQSNYTASYAIASLVEKTHLKEDYIIPKVNDPRILPFVTDTLKKAIESTLKAIPKLDKIR